MKDLTGYEFIKENWIGVGVAILLLIVSAIYLLPKEQAEVQLEGDIRPISILEDDITLEDAVVEDVEDAVEFVEGDVICDGVHNLGTAAEPVNVYYRDALNLKAGVAGLEVEALTLDQGPADPMRIVIDEDISTASTGIAAFTAQTLIAGKQYNFVVRGGANAYDRVDTWRLPCVIGEQKGATWENRPKVYLIGNFSDISTDADNVLDAAADSCLNITGKSGQVDCSFDIILETDTSGRTVKNPTLTFRDAVQGYELEAGDLVSIYLSPKFGNYQFPIGNLVAYLGTPLKMYTALAEAGDYYMTAADTGTYTLKFTYDADEIQAATDRLYITLDDLGEYRGKSAVTRSVKTAPMTLEIHWEE